MARVHGSNFKQSIAVLRATCERAYVYLNRNHIRNGLVNLALSCFLSKSNHKFGRRSICGVNYQSYAVSDSKERNSIFHWKTLFKIKLKLRMNC